MSENKGAYLFGSSKLLNRRLEEVKSAPIPTNHGALKKMTDLAIQMTHIAESALEEALHKPTYTDEEVRELAGHLNAIIKAYDIDAFPFNGNRNVIEEARGFLHSKKYFNLNYSDLIV